MLQTRRLLIYIHGFLSSPLSIKAEETKQYIEANHPGIQFVAPQLSDFPDEAYQQLVSLIEMSLTEYDQVALIGSSLGGFFATALAERFSLRAVLVNPAVNPAEHRFICKYEGEHINPYTQARFTLNHWHREALTEMYVPALSEPQNLWLMVQTADEVLDYREAVAYYAQAQQTIEEGGDHRFQGFARHLPAIVTFLFGTH